MYTSCFRGSLRNVMLIAKFDDFQPVEETRFRKDYSIVDYIHIFETPLSFQLFQSYQTHCLAYVDDDKAFDTIETWTVLESMQENISDMVDYRYVEVMKSLYDDHRSTRKAHKINPIASKDKRQGEVISVHLTLAICRRNNHFSGVFA